MPNQNKLLCQDKDLLSLEEIYEVIEAAHELGVRKVRLTGGEPLIRQGFISLVEKISRLKNINDLSMTTNGILLEHYVDALKKAGLQRINISLDTLDSQKYYDITGGGDLDKVLRGIEKVKNCGFLPIKINTVLIKGFNDNEVGVFAKWSDKWGVEVRFIELMPIGPGISWAKERYLPVSFVKEMLLELEKIESIPKGSTASYYGIKGTRTKIGLIAPISCKFCSECNRLRLTARGKLKSCLHSDEEIDLKTSLREKKDVKPFILYASHLKPKSHNLENQQYIQKSMYQIGG